MLVRLEQEVQEVLRRVKHKREAPTTTFDLGDGQIADSTFEDVDTSADRVVAARGGLDRVEWRRIRHAPFRRASGRVNWQAVGALAAVAAVLVAVLTALL